MNELERYDIESKQLLQQTAREQDLVDGGRGEVIYTFTDSDVTDVIELGDWGSEGAIPDNNVRHLFKKP